MIIVELTRLSDFANVGIPVAEIKFLEPLFDPDGIRDPSTITLSSGETMAIVESVEDAVDKVESAQRLGSYFAELGRLQARHWVEKDPTRLNE